MRVKQITIFAGLGVLATLACMQPASADVILNQPGVVDGNGVASGGSKVAYDDFALSQAATITSLSWYGVPVPSGSTFVVSFSTDSSPFSGLPNTTPFATATVTPTYTSTGFDTSIYTATLPVSVVLPPSTNLWISIVGLASDSLNGNTPWEWYVANATPDPGELSDSIVYSNGQPTYVAYPLSFELIGTSGATPTPEPASFALLGTALFGLGAVRSKQRKGR